MEDIYTLLNINKGVLQDFHLQAERLVDHQTELAINRCIRSLKEIEESVLTDKSVKVSLQNIDEVMLKVIENAKTNSQELSIWSVRELRIISYYLMKIQGNEDAYKYALYLLDKSWRDLFFNGLSFYCLDNWNTIDPVLRALTCELLRNKLLSYNGSNKKYLTMKNHANLFDEAGPHRLSALLSQKKQELNDAPSYFSNKSSTLSQSYYSDVIVKYCDSNKVMDVDVIDNIFEIHNSDRTKKLVLADLVERTGNYGDEIQRTRLCKFANRILGDITLSSTWAPFAGATEKDAQKLKRAKQLVNLWFNQKIIETFFEVCVQDRDRKEFWLKYVGNLSGFRIVGSTATKRLLQGDSRVSGIFLPYFIETDSYTSQTSALVLFIKNKMMVEFSDTGALYVYNQGHKMVNLVTKRRNAISNTADLKIPSMNNLVVTNDWGYQSYYEEGRMTHQGYWQSRLSGWLHQMVLSSDNTNVSFFDSADNEVFKATPVNKEPFKPTAKPTVERCDLFGNVREQSKSSVNTPKPLHSPQNKIEPTSKVNSVIYENNVSSNLTSKWFFNDRCRVVCNDKGYYINLYRGRRFVKVRNAIPKDKLTGSLWIKRPNPSGWTQIVHANNGLELSIGYVKEAGGGILFKQEMSQSDFMRIQL